MIVTIPDGCQSPEHKVWMRATVLSADALVLIPAVVAFARSVRARSLALVMLLLYPGLILIDNGHFQYNNVSLGWMIGKLLSGFFFGANALEPTQVKYTPVFL